MIRERAKELLDRSENLLRDADDELAGSYDATGPQRAIMRRRRNAINAACNALHRAVRAA